MGALRSQGLSYVEIARVLGISKSSVAYHARRLGVEPDDRFSKRYDWCEIQRAYDSGLTVRKCAERFGFCLASWHQAVKRGEVTARPRRMSLDDLLASGQKRGRHWIKLRLLEAGVKSGNCERCGIVDWRGHPLTLHLHHVNGDGTDNRLENLELLCPNCHSQTDTYGGRNGHRRRRGAG